MSATMSFSAVSARTAPAAGRKSVVCRAEAAPSKTAAVKLALAGLAATFLLSSAPVYANCAAMPTCASPSAARAQRLRRLSAAASSPLIALF